MSCGQSAPGPSFCVLEIHFPVHGPPPTVGYRPTPPISTEQSYIHCHRYLSHAPEIKQTPSCLQIASTISEVEMNRLEEEEEAAYRRRRCTAHMRGLYWSHPPPQGSPRLAVKCSPRTPTYVPEQHTPTNQDSHHNTRVPSVSHDATARNDMAGWQSSVECQTRRP